MTKIKSLRKFTVSVDFFEDERIIGLQALYGPAGPMVAIAILTIIYRHGYYAVWNDLTRYKLLSFLPDATPEFLDDIISKMVEWGLFDAGMFANHGVLTSADIQRQYFRAHKRESHCGPLPYLIDNERMPEPDAPVEKLSDNRAENNLLDANGRHIDALPLPISATKQPPIFAEMVQKKQETAAKASPALMVDVGI